MEKQAGFLGITNPIWGVIIVVGVVAVVAVICAFVAVMFGVNVPGLSS